jgi:RimJ/RimL family protein N-acetyltransferase
VTDQENAVAAGLILGEGLVLQPWDDDLLRAMARWSERGFPYNAFDLGFLRDPARCAEFTAGLRNDARHLHFAAIEAGQPVGRVSVNLEDPEGLYLWGVHVPPEHEGRGVCRRMLTALIDWLAVDQPNKSLVLAANTFAERALRAYGALGFAPAETRWLYDSALAEALSRLPPDRREPVAGHVRFLHGRWEVRTYLMRRPSGPAANRSRP